MACAEKKYFSPKRQTETLLLTFNFERVLTSNETIDSSTWTVETEEGTDATPTTTMVVGSAIINDARVSHLIGSGVVDNIYEIVKY